jgi:hypothetical protein
MERDKNESQSRVKDLVGQVNNLSGQVKDLMLAKDEMLDFLQDLLDVDDAEAKSVPPSRQGPTKLDHVVTSAAAWKKIGASKGTPKGSTRIEALSNQAQCFLLCQGVYVQP